MIFIYLLEKDIVFPKEKFDCMKYQPYNIKPLFSMRRILQWHDYWGGDIYISFSGGLDSCVLAYIVCLAYKKYYLKGKIPLVFVDTGIEFPEIRNFVAEYKEWLQWKFPPLDIELNILHPKHTFQWVCNNKGFPILSKETADKIKKLRHGNLSPKYRNYLLNGDERGKFGMLAKKWQFLADKNIITEDLSADCCTFLKRAPFKQYVKDTGRQPIIGITQDEGFKRQNQYNHTGCNVYSGTTIKCQPLGFWPKAEIIQFKIDNRIPICSVYGYPFKVKDKNGNQQWRFSKEQRTGCILCGFGCHLETQPNRIQRLQTSNDINHRRIYQWGMELKNNNVTYKEALEHCNIPTTYDDYVDKIS